VIENYAPVRSSDYHVFWKRLADKSPAPPRSKPIPAIPNGKFLLSPANAGAACVYTARVRYSVANPLGKIPVVGRLPRYLLAREILGGGLVAPRIPVSLPPTESTWEFPVILAHGEQARFSFEIAMALPGCHAAIQSIELTEFSRDPSVIEALTDGSRLPGEKTPAK